MGRPAVLALASPVVIGVMAKMIGSLKGVDNLAPEVLASFMMFASMTGLLLAVMLDNAGGAWDNAKKYVETGQHGGKVSRPICTRWMWLSGSTGSRAAGTYVYVYVYACGRRLYVYVCAMTVCFLYPTRSIQQGAIVGYGKEQS